MRQLKIPKIWRRALVVAIPKPEKPLGTQRVIALYLCCVSPLKSSRDSSTLVSKQSSTHCPQEQAGFQHGSLAVEQVSLLTQNIEDSFSAKKAGAVFVDLTAAYDTVWHCGLTCKLLRLLPDRHMIHIRDHGNGWQSQLCPYHRKWPNEQVTTLQEWRPTGICPGAPSLQHLHL